MFRSSNTEFRTEAPDCVARLRWLLAAIAALAALVLARVAALELWYGEAYREAASRPIERTTPLAAARGRILARNGAVLAYDREVAALAVHYRWLEQPPNRVWLRRLARSRLPRKQRRIAASVDAECRRLLAEQVPWRWRLAKLCGLAPADLSRRLAQTQARVERIVASVSERRQATMAENQTAVFSVPDDAAWWRRLLVWLDAGAAADDESDVVVAEEHEYHLIHAGLTLEAVVEIEGHPDRYPGVRVVTSRQRVYPQGSLAAHLIGYTPDAAAESLAAEAQPAAPAGQQGAERSFDSLLQGQPGTVREAADRTGRLVWRKVQREAVPGSDLIVTLDPSLERAAEQLLDHALRRRLGEGPRAASGGGAIVALDVETGAVLCAASAPRFDPQTLARGEGRAIERLFADPAKPLFNRACRMALPPGSVFKPLTAIALLEEGVVDPVKPFFCQGYLHTPRRQRCQIFRHFQRGHGPVTLVEALTQSCNVYFFHYASDLGADRLAHWAKRFGFGAPTGIDLPEETGGSVASRDRAEESRELASPEVEALAIGQGGLTATPLQMARLMAAIGNGGRLVTPHLASGIGLTTGSAGSGDPRRTERCGRSLTEPPRDIGLSAATLVAVRRGLEEVVANPLGTGYATVRLEPIKIAGKTGTAETDSGEDHAWFAGYAPADDPQVAFAVVIEHAGGGGEAAGPVARRLVEAMESLGYFSDGMAWPLREQTSSRGRSRHEIRTGKSYAGLAGDGLAADFITAD